MATSLHGNKYTKTGSKLLYTLMLAMFSLVALQWAMWWHSGHNKSTMDTVNCGQEATRFAYNK